MVVRKLNMNKYTKNINFEGINTNIPVIDVGKFENGFIVLIAQMHGDEYSSRLICNEILNINKGLEKGLRIILCANPNGAKGLAKFETITGKNLNRCFIKSKINNPKDVSGLIAKEIVDLCINAKFVIDLHDMLGSKIPICSIITLTDNQKANRKNFDLVKKFGPKIVWLEDFRKRDVRKRYSGTINSYLNSRCIPNFTIETSPINLIRRAEIKNVANKLLSLINDSKAINKLNLIERIEIYSPSEGILIPSKKPLLEKIKQGEILGILINEKLQKTFVRSTTSGILVRKCYQRFVFKNEKVFDVGKEVLWKD